MFRICWNKIIVLASKYFELHFDASFFIASCHKIYYQVKGICFSRSSALGPICRPWTLCPSVPPSQILSLQFQGIACYDRDEVLKLPTKMQLSSKNKHTLSTEEFFVSCLCKLYFPPSHLSTPASRQWNTTNTKVCVLRGLSSDLIQL